MQQSASSILFFLFKMLELVAREFLKQANRIGNEWNYLTLLAEGFHPPEGRNNNSRLRSKNKLQHQIIVLMFSLQSWIKTSVYRSVVKFQVFVCFVCVISVSGLQLWILIDLVNKT